jgi:hypothetical protein
LNVLGSNHFERCVIRTNRKNEGVEVYVEVEGRGMLAFMLLELA